MALANTKQREFGESIDCAGATWLIRGSCVTETWQSATLITSESRPLIYYQTTQTDKLISHTTRSRRLSTGYRSTVMFLPKLKLAHKGILLVALPLVLQGVFYAHLKQQSVQTEQQAKAIEASKVIVTQMNDLILQISLLFDAMVADCTGRSGKTEKHLEELLAETPTIIKRVVDALKMDGKHDQEAERVNILGTRFLTEIQRLKSRVTAEDDISILMAFANSNNFRETARLLDHQLRDVIRRENKIVLAGTEQEKLIRQQMQQWLDFAVFGNAALAIVLTLIFFRGTVSHLWVLKENSRRLAQSQPLLKEIDSSDEVGEVDRVFHEMAEKLRASAQREQSFTALLRQSESRLKSVIATIPAALVVVDEGGTIESLNPTAERLFNYQSEDLLSKKVSLLLHTRGSSETKSTSLVEQLLKDSAARPFVMEGIDSDHEYIPLEVSASKFATQAGDRILLTMVDITERIRLEQLKRDFVAMVSHDIRTPLTSISTTIDLVRSGRFGELTNQAQNTLGTAESNAARLLQMVERLLNIEKLESGLVEFSVSPFAVSDLFLDALQSVEQAAKEKNVSIEVEETTAQAAADLDSITQVLCNLLANALRYSPANSKIIVKAEDVDKEHWEIQVIDQGPGVAEHLKTQIFERFKQADARRDKKEGFGLGLAICKSIITQHGQHIGVRDSFSTMDASDANGSDANGKTGSIFWFTLAKADKTDDKLDEQESNFTAEV